MSRMNNMYLPKEALDILGLKKRIRRQFFEANGVITAKEYRKRYMNEVIFEKETHRKDSRKQTKPERKIEEQLVALGVPFVREFSILMFDYDFYLPEENILIEVDGDFWHPGDIENATYNFQKKNYINDIKKNCIAKAKGIDIIRIRESFINELEYEELRNYLEDQIALILEERKDNGETP